MARDPTCSPLHRCRGTARRTSRTGRGRRARRRWRRRSTSPVAPALPRARSPQPVSRRLACRRRARTTTSPRASRGDYATPLAVVANDRATLGRATLVSTLLAVLADGGSTTAAPAALDPYAATAAVFPAALFPAVTDALARVVTAAPDPAAAVRDPVALNEHEAGTNLDGLVARRRRIFIDLDNRDRRRGRDVATGFDHAAGGTRDERGGDHETSETNLKRHKITCTHMTRHEEQTRDKPDPEKN